jgi:hypothetical protein
MKQVLDVTGSHVPEKEVLAEFHLAIYRLLRASKPGAKFNFKILVEECD